jgi:anaerobic ribonucleoside-triphosphate reductase activating protein
MTIPRLSLSKLHFPITALGPGRRIGIWLQGCSIRCAGCMSRDTWAFSRDSEPSEGLLERMAPWLTEADGVTISGGEPFDQPYGLLALLARLRERFKGDVLVYSGYEFEALRAQHGAALAAICLADLSNGGRGVRNQLEAHFVNPLARAAFALDMRAGERLLIEDIERADGVTSLKIARSETAHRVA